MLLDVFGADPEFGPASARALRSARSEGAIVACEVVWAEVSAAFPSHHAAFESMRQLGVDYSPGHHMIATAAGGSWRDYRAAGSGRSRIMPDFLIAAHALYGPPDRLLTRDRGFYGNRFKGLAVVDPTDTAP